MGNPSDEPEEEHDRPFLNLLGYTPLGDVVVAGVVCLVAAVAVLVFRLLGPIAIGAGLLLAGVILGILMHRVAVQNGAPPPVASTLRFLAVALGLMAVLFAVFVSLWAVYCDC